MVTKLSDAKNKRLIIIQFLDDKELKTGYALASNVKQSSPYIENVNYFESSAPDEILSFIKDEIPKLISSEEDIALYIDSHGVSSGNGIGHKNGFISWDELKENIREIFKNQINPPIIILTACKGNGFKKELTKDKYPICSKLIASDGILPNGILMGAFANVFNEHGIKFGSQEIDEINKKLKDREFSSLIITHYH